MDLENEIKNDTIGYYSSERSDYDFFFSLQAKKTEKRKAAETNWNFVFCILLVKNNVLTKIFQAFDARYEFQIPQLHNVDGQSLGGG